MERITEALWGEDEPAPPGQSARSWAVIARIGTAPLALTQPFLAAVALVREMHGLPSNALTRRPA